MKPSSSWKKGLRRNSQPLGIEDPDLLMFVSSLVDGLVIGRIYGTQPSISQQSKLLAKMLTAYLEAEAATP